MAVIVSRLVDIERRCADHKLRLTEQRRLVLRVVAEAKNHPDVAELHRRAAKRDNRVSLATVYRTVRRLEGAGIIERHAFRDGRARFAYASQKHHDHLIDVATGKVLEFNSPEIERLQRKIARRLGFRLVGHRLELYGERISLRTAGVTL